MKDIVMSKRFKTVCFVGYSSISCRHQNPMAHGGIQLCQARKKANGILQGRYVNTNGTHEEIGTPFDLSNDQYNHWINISKNTK